MSRLTGYQFLLAASGRQEGRDMRVRAQHSTHIAVECKRYSKATELDERELLGELARAIGSIPELDCWVLVTSRPVPDLLEQALASSAEKSGVVFAQIDASGHSLSRLGTLCALFPDEVLKHLPKAVGQVARQALLTIGAYPDFEEAVQKIRRDFSSGSMGFDRARRQSHSWLAETLSDQAQSKAAFSQPLAVATEALPRTRFLDVVDRWFVSKDSVAKPLTVLGEEGDGKTWLVAHWISRHLLEAEFPLVLWLSSSQVTEQEPADVLAEALHRTSRHISKEIWRRRLLRWIDSDRAEPSGILLVLDGVK